MKNDIEELEDLLLSEENDEHRSKISLSTIFSLLVLNWQYFLISIIVFLCGAMLYLRYTEPTYKMTARLLIKSDDKRLNSNASQMISNMMDLGNLTNSTGFENELEVLKSRILIRDVVKDLKLYSEYRLKGRIRNIIVYGSQPVTVELDPVHLDSLDREFLEHGHWASIQLTISKKDSAYEIEGTIHQGDNRKSHRKPVSFSEKELTLPANITTPIGILSLTESPRYEMNPDEVYLVTIRPPIAVASDFLRNMTVESTSKLTDIALIKFVDKHRLRGMDFLRNLAVCYNRQANADKNEIALRTEAFINDRVVQISRELGSTEGQIEDFKRKNSVTSLTFDASQAVQMSNQYSSRLLEANTQMQMIDYLTEYVENPKNKYQIIPTNIGISDEASSRLIANYNEAVLNRNKLLKSVSEWAPQVLTLTATIEELENSIKTALQQARRSAEINRRSVLDEFAKYNGQVSSAPGQERILTQIGRQLDIKSGIYLLLLQKREENSIALAATADKGKLIDEPLFEGKVKPKSMTILFFALLLALALPFGVLYIINLLRYKIEGHDDVEKLTHLPIVADIAWANDNVKSSAGIVVHADKNTQMDEVFRLLRTNIQFLLKENQKTILFTSGTSGEGKTFCAANLASSFALLGKKVILCGLDIRKPALGRLFNVSDKSKGISPLLKKDNVTREDLSSQIVTSSVNENLDLLLAGPIPPNPTELLARDSFRQIIALLQQYYDYVILDTAPVGLVTDTLQIVTHADVSVFVCRADYTPKSTFDMLNSLNKEGKLPNACVVVNGIDMSRRKYGYYYGYGSYGKLGQYGSRSYGTYGHYGMYSHYADSHYGQEDDNSIKR